MLTGGCFCGAIRYEAGGTPFHATLCHCADCRRAAGAPVVAWFSVPAADYRVVAGAPKTFASSAQGERSFCPACGTTLTFQSRRSLEEIDVTTASLDDPDHVSPLDHTRADARVSWWDGLGELPRHRGARPRG